MSRLDYEKIGVGINVKDKGLIGDGITNDSTTLKASFNMTNLANLFPLGLDLSPVNGISDGWMHSFSNASSTPTIDNGYQKIEITSSSSSDGNGSISYMYPTCNVGDITTVYCKGRVASNVKSRIRIAFYNGAAYISSVYSDYNNSIIDVNMVVRAIAPEGTTKVQILMYANVISNGDTGAACFKDLEFYKNSESTPKINLHFPVGIYKLATSIIIPTHVSMTFDDGAMFKRTDGSIIYIHGKINADAQQIFSDDGGLGSFIGPPQSRLAYPEWFGALGGTTNDTIAIENTRVFLDTGTIKFTKPLYTAHIHLTNGIFIEGCGVGTTVLKGAIQATPIITVGDSVLAQNWGWRDLTIDAEGIDTGVYISNAYYGYCNRYIIKNAILDNYLAENKANKSVMLIYNDMCQIFNGLRYNIRSLYTTGLAGASFNTTIQFTNVTSFNSGVTNVTSGRLVYITSELLYYGYIEGLGANLIEIDKTQNNGANGGGTLKSTGTISIDGDGTSDVVVLKAAAPMNVHYFLVGQIAVDGKINNVSTGISETYYTSNYSVGASLLVPKIQGWIDFADSVNKDNSPTKSYPRIQNSGGALLLNTNTVDSIGLMTYKFFNKPERIAGANLSFAQRIWCDSTNGVMRSKTSAPASETDGAIFTNMLVAVPTTLSSAGLAGQYACDSKYFYFCYAPNSWTKFLTNNERVVVDRFDDFIYQLLTENNTNWILNKGTYATDPAISGPSVLALVTGANSGVITDDASQIVDSIPVQCNYGGLVIECGIKISTSITGLSVSVGLTDNKNLQEPVEIHSAPCTFAIATDKVTRSAHGLVNNDVIFFSTIVGTTGITTGTSLPTKYFVVNKTNDDFQLSTTPSGTAVDLLTIDGTGTYIAFHKKEANDSVCLVYDDAADVKQWFAYSIDSGAIDNNSKATGIAPSTTVFQKIRITIDSTGNIIEFYIDDVLVGNMPGSALGISPDVPLYLTVVANSTTTASKTVFVDYLKVTHNRP